MYVTLDHTEDVAANIRTFWFKPKRPVRYDAGQFIELYLPHQPADNRGQKRWFTLSSSPSEDLLSLTTKFATTHSSSFKQELHNLAVGAELLMADPMGDFVLPKDMNIPLVFVAGGIGVTPMRSMITWLQSTGQKRDITLLYAASEPAELAFTALFTAHLGEHFIPLITTSSPDWKGESGPIDAARIQELAPASAAALYYLSGPEPMIETLAKGLKQRGVPRHQIITDYFPGYPA